MDAFQNGNRYQNLFYLLRPTVNGWGYLSNAR